MAELVCVNCAAPFDVAADDPLWSRTTAIIDGTEIIVGRHIEPPCPLCGSVAAHVGVDDDGNLVGVANRLDVVCDPPESFGGH